MKPALELGLSHKFKYTVPDNKTVPHLYPESAEFQAMPNVLATGFMVGLFEWTCIQLVNPHIDWPNEQTVGISVNFSHLAATPPGLTVTVNATLSEIKDRKLTFSIIADDGVDTISKGSHERFIIDADNFNQKLSAKLKGLTKG